METSYEWITISNDEQYWNILYGKFHFIPSFYSSPLIIPPLLYVEYSISAFFDDTLDESVTDAMLDDLYDKA